MKPQDNLIETISKFSQAQIFNLHLVENLPEYMSLHCYTSVIITETLVIHVPLLCTYESKSYIFFNFYLFVIVTQRERE